MCSSSPVIPARAGATRPPQRPHRRDGRHPRTRGGNPGGRASQCFGHGHPSRRSMIQAAISSPPCTVRSSSRSRSRRTRLGPVLLPVPLSPIRPDPEPALFGLRRSRGLRSCFQVAAGCCRSVGPCLNLRAGVRHQFGQPLEAVAFSGLPRLCQPVRQPRLVTAPGCLSQCCCDLCARRRSHGPPRCSAVRLVRRLDALGFPLPAGAVSAFPVLP